MRLAGEPSAEEVDTIHGGDDIPRVLITRCAFPVAMEDDVAEEVGLTLECT